MAKKDLSKLNIGDLEDRLTKAKKRGNKAAVKRISAVLKKKRAKKAKKAQARLDNIFNSPLFEGLTEFQQKTLRKLVESYEPVDVRSGELTKAEKKAIANEAARAVDPYYDAERDDITADYEEGLSNQIESFRTTIGDATRDMYEALANNNAYVAEQKKTEIANLQATITGLEEERDIYVRQKRQFLETQISDIQADLSTGLGRITEDEAVQLRQLERGYKNNLDTLQKNMVARGYTWSTRS